MNYLLGWEVSESRCRVQTREGREAGRSAIYSRVAILEHDQGGSWESREDDKSDDMWRAGEVQRVDDNYLTMRELIATISEHRPGSGVAVACQEIINAQQLQQEQEQY